jgi:hypothetical protein
MTRSMTRWVLMGCTALAAFGAAAVLDVGSRAAEAAPSVSLFAGSYVGNDPLGWGSRIGGFSSWPVTISDGGQITSSYSGSGRTKGSISGRVSADGSYSFTVSVTSAVYFPNRHGGGPDYVTDKYDSAGNMALDVDGNIVGTEETNTRSTSVGSFFWVRQ